MLGAIIGDIVGSVLNGIIIEVKSLSFLQINVL